MTMLQKLLRCNAMELTLAVAILASSLLVGFEVQLMSSKLDTSLPLACAGPPRSICPSEHAFKACIELLQRYLPTSTVKNKEVKSG